MASAWFTKWPGRLEQELQALDGAGIRYSVTEGPPDGGILELQLDLTVGGEDLHLVARYPDAFPYTRPVVFAPDLELSRHQHPFDRNLCLLGRSTANWTSDRTLAWLLVEQLPKALAAARDPLGTAADEEERQGEPISDYYLYQPGAALAIDSRWLVGEAEGGQLKVLVDRSAPRPVPHTPIIRGVVAEVRATGAGSLHRADPGLLRLVQDGVEVTGRWARVDAPPPQAIHLGAGWREAFVQELRAIDPRLAAPQHEQFGNGDWIDIVGLVFREEQEWREYGEGWLFFVRVGQRQGSRRQRRADDWKGYLAKAVRLGQEDLTTRVPELAGLAGKRAAIIGLGGLGAPMALELARAGIAELRMLDGDTVDPATLVRWPFGFAAAQRPKVEVIKESIETNIPYVAVRTWWHALGRSRAAPEELGDFDVLNDVLTGVDLVIDATAEAGLHPMIADQARMRGIPYLEASTRNGAWGGVIARVGNQPGEACQNCLAFQLADLDAQGQPARSPEGLRQPVGCADPTFTGAGFDLATISLAATRLAVATLLRGVDGAYPDPSWDIAVVNLRASDGSAGAPEWRTSLLERHPGCDRADH